MSPTFLFCPKCGGRLAQREHAGRTRPVCPGCGFIVYQNPAPGVAVIVLDQQHRILLARRKGGRYADHWCIPCGWVEWDEDLRDAAVREMSEETGLEVALGDVAAVHSNFHDPQAHSVGIWFYGHITGGQLAAGDDVSEVGFFDLDDLPEPLAFPTDRLVLEQLRAKRSKS